MQRSVRPERDRESEDKRDTEGQRVETSLVRQDQLGHITQQTMKIPRPPWTGISPVERVTANETNTEPFSIQRVMCGYLGDKGTQGA